MGARLRLAPDPEGNGNAPSVASPIRVALAERHDLMRRGLRLLLDREDDILVVADHQDLGAAIDSARREDADVLAVDLQMFDGAGDGSPPLDGRLPGVAIVVVTMSDLPALAARTLLTGALGFVQKQFADSELAPAVRAAARGEVYVSPPIAARLGPSR